MNATTDAFACKWCGMRGRCDAQCEYYESRPRMAAHDAKNPSKIQEMAYELKVSDAMSLGLITVTPETPMSEVREIFRQNRIAGLPVINGGQLVGITTFDDLITCLLDGSIDELVSKNMTSDVKSLHADEPLIHAVGKFDKLGHGHFPVLDRGDGRLVGIITKGDVIQSLLEKLHVSYHEDESDEYAAHRLFKDFQACRPILTLRHTIHGGMYKSAGKECGQLKKNLSRLGIPRKIIRRVTVATCEAELNIIVFTEGGEIVVEIEKDLIRVRAVDSGPGIPDIDRAMKPGFSTAPDWVREMGFGAGMGLPNIKNCSDVMRLESTPATGTHLEFEVYLTNETEKAD